MMTETECIEELKAKGWTRGVHNGADGAPRAYRNNIWTLSRSARGWDLTPYAGRERVKPRPLAAVLASVMPGSAGITVAAYFGLRNPGVEV